MPIIFCPANPRPMGGGFVHVPTVLYLSLFLVDMFHSSDDSQIKTRDENRKEGKKLRATSQENNSKGFDIRDCWQVFSLIY